MVNNNRIGCFRVKRRLETNIFIPDAARERAYARERLKDQSFAADRSAVISYSNSSECHTVILYAP